MKEFGRGKGKGKMMSLYNLKEPSKKIPAEFYKLKLQTTILKKNQTNKEQTNKES